MPAEMNQTPIVTLLCFLLPVLIKATSVDITQEWKRDFGWELVCHWALDMDDSLQSVMLSKNKQLFFIFRPENLGGELRKSNTFNLNESTMAVDCVSPVEHGIEGKCRITIEPHVAPKHDFSFGCGASGERPYFRIAEKEISVEAFVQPSIPTMVVTRQGATPPTINCTTSGMPAPKIVWTVDNQTVPHHFHNAAWNATSKLWDVWSTFTPQPDAVEIQCTPEVMRGNQQFRGLPVQYSNAYRIFLDWTILFVTAISSLLLR